MERARSAMLTVTVKLQLALFPLTSVATFLTVVVPGGKTEPEDGVETTLTPEHESLAPTVRLTTAPLAEVAGTVRFAGQVIVGVVRSLTVIVWVAEPELPAGSVAVQVITVVPAGYGSVSGFPSLRAPTGVRVPAQVSTAV